MKRYFYLTASLFTITLLTYGCTRSLPDATQTGIGGEVVPTFTLGSSLVTNTPPSTLSSPPQSPGHVTLTVKVVDAQGSPIQDSQVFNSLTGQTRLSDSQGVTNWEMSLGDNIDLSVSAEGYIERRITGVVDLETTTIEALLEDQPLITDTGLCRAEETLLYSEDFQDGEAAGWLEIDLGAGGWEILEEPGDESNLVVSASGAAPLFSRLEGPSFQDMIWRLRFKIVDPVPGFYNFQWNVSDGSAYQYGFHSDLYDQPLVRIDADGEMELNNPKAAPPSAGEWHLLELSAFQGLVWVFLDDRESTTFLDVEPLPGGAIGLELAPGGGTILLDDFAVCGLEEPAMPLNLRE